MNTRTEPYRIRVWDLPTRLFHWTLALAVLGALATGLRGGDAMVWHLRLGQAVLALLLFRGLWGLMGGRWSRFASFCLHPRQIMDYLRGQGGARLRTGHSPLGSLSTLGLLLLLAMQVASGLVSDDEIATTGPLTHLVSNATVALATLYHKGWGKLLILAMVCLHILAIALYTVRGQALVGAMLHGDKSLDEAMPASRDDGRTRLFAAVLALLCLGASAWVFTLSPPAY